MTDKKELCSYNPGNYYINYMLEDVTEEYTKQNPYPEALVIPIDEALKLIEEVNNASYIKPVPKKITADRYNEMLNILPPQRWSTYGQWEAFAMSERMTGTITGWYARNEKGEYYTFYHHTYATTGDIIAKLDETKTTYYISYLTTKNYLTTGEWSKKYELKATDETQAEIIFIDNIYPTIEKSEMLYIDISTKK